MNQLLKRVSVLIGVLMYIVLLNWSYINIISPAYKYMGFFYEEPPLLNLCMAYILMMLPSLLMPYSLKRPSLIVYWLLYMIVFMPSILIPLFAIKMDYNYLLLMQLILTMIFSGLSLIYKLPLLKIRKVSIKSIYFWPIILIIGLLFNAYIISVFGFNLRYLSFNEVYETRTDYINTISYASGILPYIIGWQANILNPLFMIQGLVVRNYSFFLVGLLGQLMIYSISGFKSVFFSIALVIAIYIITRFFNKDRGAAVFLWGGAFCLLLTIFSHTVLNSNILSSLLLQRTITMPGLLTGQYYQFFTENAKALLGHSIFKTIVEYPYSVQPPFLIGEFFYNSPTTEANANVWADAFANFGFGGMIIYSLLFAVILWIYDSISKDLDFNIACMMLGVPALTLANSSLLTSLLSHGIALCFLIIYLIPRSDITESKLTLKRIINQFYKLICIIRALVKKNIIN